MKTTKEMNASHDADSHATGTNFSSIDDIIRRKLRVGDPAKADEIAGALLKLYPAEAKWVKVESVSLAELHFRKSNVIKALRELSGTAVDTTWGRRSKGYQMLFDKIEETDQADLEPLLQESVLDSLLGELIQQGSGKTSSKKAVFNTSLKLALKRVNRLRNLGWKLVSKSSFEPPLASFVLALEIFLCPFD